MTTEYAFDAIPVGVLWMLMIFGAIGIYEVGFRVGRWWQEHTPDEKEGSTGLMVGSLLATLGFLLAVTMGMASGRFDDRRSLVLAEANAIGTTYLRAGYLPDPQGSEIRNLLRAYVPLRINVPELAQVQANNVRSVAIQNEIWTRTQSLAKAHPDWDVVGLFIGSVNDMIDIQNSRAVAGIYSRVPDMVLWELIGGGALTLLMVGYNAGLTRKRSLVGAVILVIVMSAVITLVVDLDRPRDGFVTVNQQALIDLAQQLGPPLP